MNWCYTLAELVFWKNKHAATYVFFLVALNCLCLIPAYANKIITDATGHDSLQTTHLQINTFSERARTFFNDAEDLRKEGHLKEAAHKYLEAIRIDPSLYVAYHQLCLSSPEATQLDEAVEKLNQLKTLKPKELLLRVALSELLEQQGKYYPAARALIDLVYLNAVPDKYLLKVNTRIHFLLSKAKNSEATEKSKMDNQQDIDPDTPTSALDETVLKKNLVTSQTKRNRATQGFGHAPLLP